jgi:hypothetical protein
VLLTLTIDAELAYLAIPIAGQDEIDYHGYRLPRISDIDCTSANE